MNQNIKTLDENIKVFMSMKDELTKHHYSKFVLIYDGEYIDSFDTFNNAAQEAVTRFGEGPYLIRQVGMPDTMSIPASIAYQPYYDNS